MTPEQMDCWTDGPMPESLIRGTNTNNNNNIYIHDAHARGRSSLTPIGPSVQQSISGSVRFHCAGHPVTQGSKRAFVAGGHARLVEAGGARHKLWRNAVNDEARLAWAGRPPLDGPVILFVAFELQPPKSKPKRRRTWPVGQRSGDIDKLTRAVLDSLTGVVYLDDAQVITATISKDWAAAERGPGVTITVIPVVAEGHNHEQ